MVINGANGKVMNVAGHFHSIGLTLGTTSVFSYLGESKVKMVEILCPRGEGVEESSHGKKRKIKFYKVKGKTKYGN